MITRMSKAAARLAEETAAEYREAVREVRRYRADHERALPPQIIAGINDLRDEEVVALEAWLTGESIPKRSRVKTVD